MVNRGINPCRKRHNQITENKKPITSFRAMYEKMLCVIRIMTLFVLHLSQSYKPNLYTDIVRVIKSNSRFGVYLKGSSIYEKRRKVQNGLCADMYPDVIVVPKSAADVSKIVQIARFYNVPISVRSGGHTYTCQSIKSGIITTNNI